MLVSPYLSPVSRSICLDHNVACLDFYGNAQLAFGSVYIERSVPDRPKSETRAQRSLLTPRAGAILRVLLRDPARAWRVRQTFSGERISDIRSSETRIIIPRK